MKSSKQLNNVQEQPIKTHKDQECTRDDQKTNKIVINNFDDYDKYNSNRCAVDMYKFETL
ncbi:MAG: hypothetical protein ACW98X_12095 [Promethearchaeota archaeon]|jgi:hypothetical protein